MKIKQNIWNFPIEALIWLMALVGLAVFSSPSESHVTLCPLSLSGIEWCPGCGIGRSIGAALRFEFSHSLQMHPLGIPAVLILLYRIIKLTRNYILKDHGKSNRITTGN